MAGTASSASSASGARAAARERWVWPRSVATPAGVSVRLFSTAFAAGSGASISIVIRFFVSSPSFFQHQRIYLIFRELRHLLIESPSLLLSAIHHRPNFLKFVRQELGFRL